MKKKIAIIGCAHYDRIALAIAAKLIITEHSPNVYCPDEDVKKESRRTEVAIFDENVPKSIAPTGFVRRRDRRRSERESKKRTNQ